MRTFSILCAGQAVSLMGNAATRFALGLWVYQQTGSVTLFSLLLLLATLPIVIAGPCAGALIDRWSKRAVLIVSEVVGIMAIAAVMVAWSMDSLTVFSVGIALVVSALGAAFQEPALVAAMTQMVPVSQLGRANGMLQLTHAVAHTLAPMLGSAILSAWGMGTVFAIDLATFVAAIATLAVIRTPKPVAHDKTSLSLLLVEIMDGWRVIARHRGLLALLCFYAAVNLLAGTAHAIFGPMVLGFASARGFGVIMSLGGAGMIAGSAVMIVWRGPARRIRAVLLAAASLGVALAIGGLAPSLAVVAIINVCAMFALPFINGYDAAVWQSLIPVEAQGRAFATRNMIASATLPVAYVVAGPLADRVFRPLYDAQPPDGVFRLLVGPGDDRGIALLLVTIGALIAVATAIAWSSSRVRALDQPAGNGGFTKMTP